jgi:hypothetical protein
MPDLPYYPFELTPKSFPKKLAFLGLGSTKLLVLSHHQLLHKFYLLLILMVIEHL